MIYKIRTVEEAEAILRLLATNLQNGDVIFDISSKIDPHTVPLCIRRCRTCQQPSEYIGPNMWGAELEKRAVYCQACGYAMAHLVSVDLAVCGSKVVNSSYRPKYECIEGNGSRNHPVTPDFADSPKA